MSLGFKQGPDGGGLIGCATEFELNLGKGKWYMVLSRNVRRTGVSSETVTLEAL